MINRCILFNDDRYTRDDRADRALEYFLRLRRPNVFELIREHDLFSAVRDKAILLMEFDQYLYEKNIKERKEAGQAPSKLAPEDELTKGPAVQLMVQHTDEIPVGYYASVGGGRKSEEIEGFCLSRKAANFFDIPFLFHFVRSRAWFLSSGVSRASCIFIWMRSS